MRRRLVKHSAQQRRDGSFSIFVIGRICADHLPHFVLGANGSTRCTRRGWGVAELITQNVSIIVFLIGIKKNENPRTDSHEVLRLRDDGGGDVLGEPGGLEVKLGRVELHLARLVADE